MGAYDLSFDELLARVDAAGQPAFRARQIWDGLYTRGTFPADLTTLPAALRNQLSADSALGPSLDLAVESVSDGGETVKWLWSLAKDGKQIETVLMHYAGRTTVCVSSQ